MRTNITLVAILAALLAVTAGCTSRASQASPSPTPVAVTLADFMVEPMDLSVDGPFVSFAVHNEGPTVHNFSIRDANSGEILLATPDLRPGERTTLAGQLEAGEYETLCALPGHASLGMRGVVTVRAP
ncbi:MAG: cupredoxin domain-containing protein [Chloroflexota bacterium]|nr:cupredoxin domain-containing protein [Chloroflexota bacterium]